VRIDAGISARSKVVAIDGIDPATAARRLLG
jgi:hypothetical protein